MFHATSKKQRLTNGPLQTSGSIASPARSAGTVGLKPTSSLTSRHGVYYVSELQESVGIMAKTVQDAAIVLTAIAGEHSAKSFQAGPC